MVCGRKDNTRDAAEWALITTPSVVVFVRAAADNDGTDAGQVFFNFLVVCFGVVFEVPFVQPLAIFTQWLIGVVIFGGDEAVKRHAHVHDDFSHKVILPCSKPCLEDCAVPGITCRITKRSIASQSKKHPGEHQAFGSRYGQSSKSLGLVGNDTKKALNSSLCPSAPYLWDVCHFHSQNPIRQPDRSWSAI